MAKDPEPGTRRPGRWPRTCGGSSPTSRSGPAARRWRAGGAVVAAEHGCGVASFMLLRSRWWTDCGRMSSSPRAAEDRRAHRPPNRSFRRRDYIGRICLWPRESLDKSTAPSRGPTRPAAPPTSAAGSWDYLPCPSSPPGTLTYRAALNGHRTLPSAWRPSTRSGPSSDAGRPFFTPGPRLGRLQPRGALVAGTPQTGKSGCVSARPVVAEPVPAVAISPDSQARRRYGRGTFYPRPRAWLWDPTTASSLAGRGAGTVNSWRSTPKARSSRPAWIYSWKHSRLCPVARLCALHVSTPGGLTALGWAGRELHPSGTATKGVRPGRGLSLPGRWISRDRTSVEFIEICLLAPARVLPLPRTIQASLLASPSTPTAANGHRRAGTRRSSSGSRDGATHDYNSREHRDPSSDLAFIPDGPRLASGAGEDRSAPALGGDDRSANPVASNACFFRGRAVALHLTADASRGAPGWDGAGLGLHTGRPFVTGVTPSGSPTWPISARTAAALPRTNDKVRRHESRLGRDRRQIGIRETNAWDSFTGAPEPNDGRLAGHRLGSSQGSGAARDGTPT